MSDLSELIDILNDDGVLHSTGFTARVGFRAIGVASFVTSSSWVPFTGLFSYLLNSLLFPIFSNKFASYFVGYSFGIVDLCIVIFKIREYISSRGFFRFVMLKYYFGICGRSSLSDVLADSYLDITISDRWYQSISIECREVRKRKGCNHSKCLFFSFVSHLIGQLVVILSNYASCIMLVYVVNLSSIFDHVKFEIIYLLRRGVSWIILVKLVTPIYSPRL